MDPADDLTPEPPRERRMDIALEPLGGAVERSARSTAERCAPARAR